ncbi:MAG: FAD-dependent oxidoreductase [Lentisphaeria bacterium]|nr:FAD-dependent oxidoreductase [Lentisphaeria bacterium]
MNTILEPAREIPVTHEVDLVVAGGGTAGVACAVCAARAGLKVVMIEQTAQAGGMVTAVTQWLALYDLAPKGGFAQEFFSYMEKNEIYRKPCYNRYRLVTWFDRLLVENGVTVLFLTRAVAPIMEDGRIAGLIVESKRGRHAIRAKAVVDATGDGDIAALAGAEFEYGRPQDGRIQSASLSFTIGGFRHEVLNLKDELLPALRQVRPDYSLPYDAGNARPMPGVPDHWMMSISHAFCDPLDPESLSKGLIEMRRQSEELMDLINRTPYGNGGLFGMDFSPLPGIRESRRIISDADVTDADWSEGKFYDDGIITVYHNIDIHRCAEGEPAIIVEKVKPYQIRYGALLPRGLSGILTVGRCIGGSHKALASYRLIPDCMAMGEAAALAVSQSIARGVDLRRIEVAELRRELIARGSNLTGPLPEK